DVAGVLDRDRVVDDVAGAVRRAVRNGGRLGDGEGRVVDQGHRGGGRVRAALVGGRRGLVVQGAVPVVALAVQVRLGQRVAGLVDPRLTHVQHTVAVAVAAGRTRHARAGVGFHLVADT